jgi:phenylacetate-CoA ligase
MSRPTLELSSRLDDSQWWPVEQHRARQLAKLNTLLNHATSHCPFYATQLSGFCVLERLAELRRLPLLTREMLRTRCDAMRSSEHFQPLVGHTHGTADEPVRFYWDRTRQAWDKAHRLRGHSWHGFGIGDRELHFWPIDPPRSVRGRLQQGLRTVRDRLTGELQLDMMKLPLARHDLIKEWGSEWRRFDPVRVSAYPSAFSELLRNSSIPSHRSSLQSVFLTGEVTFSWQRRLIEEALGGVIVQSYGLQEVGPIAFECERGNWHTCAESVIVEIIRGGRPARIGELGEIVVTGLQSEVMPMIRYCTGDIVRAEAARGCPCGRGLPVMPAVLGRAGDFLEDADGRWISPQTTISCLGGIVPEGTFRVLQDERDDITVQLSEWAGVERSRVESAIRGLLGSTFRCHIQQVSSLSRTRFGKLRYVQSARTIGGLAQGESAVLSI